MMISAIQTLEDGQAGREVEDGGLLPAPLGEESIKYFFPDRGFSSGTFCSVAELYLTTVGIT
jgi:hypothetical protein